MGRWCSTWLSSGLVDDHQVCDVVGPASLHQRPHLVVSSVHPLGAWEHELHLLRNTHYHTTGTTHVKAVYPLVL